MTQATHAALTDTDHARSPLRALCSLTSAQAAQVVAGLSSLAGTWNIERHESCDGHLSLLVSHTACEATILVDRDHAGIHVSLVLADTIHTSEHRHPTTGEAVFAIKTLAASPTLHDMRKSA